MTFQCDAWFDFAKRRKAVIKKCQASRRCLWGLGMAAGKQGARTYPAYVAAGRSQREREGQEHRFHPFAQVCLSFLGSCLPHDILEARRRS